MPDDVAAMGSERAQGGGSFSQCTQADAFGAHWSTGATAQSSPRPTCLAAWLSSACLLRKVCLGLCREGESSQACQDQGHPTHTAVRSHCTEHPPCILEATSSPTHARAHVKALCTLAASPVPRRWDDPAAATSSSDSRLCPGWGRQSTGHRHLPNLPPHLVPGKPSHLQLCLHGGVKNPVKLQRRLRRFALLQCHHVL